MDLVRGEPELAALEAEIVYGVALCIAVGVPVISQVELSITKPVGNDGFTLQLLGVPPAMTASPLVPMDTSFVRSSTLAVVFDASL